MTQSKNYILVGLLCSMLVYIGCQDPETIDVSPEYAIPLVSASMSIQDVLDQTNTGNIITVDGDNFITVEYRKDVLGIDTVNLITIPGFSIPQLIPTQVIPTPFPSGVDIDNFTVKNGKMFINFESNSPNDITVTIDFPSIKKNGNNLQYTMNVANPNGTVPLVYQDSFDLATYRFLFNNDNFRSNYTATDDVTGLPVVLSNFFFNYPNIEHSYIEGYFGQESFVLPTQELGLTLLEQWVSGQVTFTEPRIKLRFENSYGFPIRVDFDTLQAVTRDAGNFDIQVNGFDNGKNLNYPSLNDVGEEEISNVIMNNNNSNIVTVLEQVPYGLRYQFSGEANPAGDQSIKGFATDESNIVIRVIAELPMEGAVQDFTLIDTFALDLTGDAIPEGEAEFKIITDNGFPLDIDLQCYFLDAFGNAVDSLFLGSDTRLIQAAAIDGTGRVTESFETITFVDVTSDRVNSIRNQVSNIALLGRFNSTDNGSTPIRLYADYDLDVKIGVKIKPVVD
ncbi:MAG: hypothetical protein AB8G11_13985 [Saprospiraceae bacterium]